MHLPEFHMVSWEKQVLKSKTTNYVDLAYTHITNLQNDNSYYFIQRKRENRKMINKNSFHGKRRSLNNSNMMVPVAVMSYFLLLLSILSTQTDHCYHVMALKHRSNSIILSVYTDKHSKREKGGIVVSDLILTSSNKDKSLASTGSQQKIYQSSVESTVNGISESTVFNDKDSALLENLSLLKEDSNDQFLLSPSTIRKKGGDLIQRVRCNYNPISFLRGGTSNIRKPLLIKKTEFSEKFVDGFLGRTFCLFLAILVSLQTVGVILSHNDHAIFDELASKLLSEETARAVKTVRLLLTRFSEYGVQDIFALYSTKDILSSILALARLQKASIFANELLGIQKVKIRNEGSTLFHRLLSLFGLSYKKDIMSKNDFHAGTISGCMNDLKDELELLSDLSHYAVFANAAYGWKLGFALSGSLHLGDLKALVTKTGIRREDVVATRWHSSTHLPAYFIVRDSKRKKLVLCIRGTLSAKDVLTDLCCIAEDFVTDDSPANDKGDSFKNIGRSKYKARAHQGMLEAARGVSRATRRIIASELASNPDFNLVITGHSLGGGTAAVLGTMWQDTFPGLTVYAYGCPCVGPIDTNPTLNDSIISVVSEGDPFATLSIGHIADTTNAISQLCINATLRNEILARTNSNVEEMIEEDLRWCYEQIKLLRENSTSEKFYPSGRILFLTENVNEETTDICLHEVHQEKFSDLVLHPKMMDITRHIPNRYEELLRRLRDTVTS